MRKYVIVAESGADLSPEIIKCHPIHVAPMHVAIDNKDYLDGYISINEICDYYNTTGKVPKTAAVNPEDYSKIYEQIRKDNPDSIIIHACYSKVLSCSYQNAVIAGEDLKQIYHADTKNVTIGQAFTVIRIAEYIEKNPNATPEEIVKRIEEYAEMVRFSFVPGNLDYLRAGGRVSNAQYLGASILKIKPLVEVLNGEMITTKKYLGTRKFILREMINDYFSKYNIDKELIYLVYVQEIDEELKNYIEKYVRAAGVKQIIWNKAGGVITSHSGPGGIGIAGIELKKRVG